MIKEIKNWLSCKKKEKENFRETRKFGFKELFKKKKNKVIFRETQKIG